MSDTPRIVSFGNITVDFKTRQIHGTDRHLPPLAFDVLEYLTKRRGHIVTRRELLREVWDIDADIDTRRVDRQIVNVRRAIGDDAVDPAYLRTVYSTGWVLEPDRPDGGVFREGATLGDMVGFLDEMNAASVKHTITGPNDEPVAMLYVVRGVPETREAETAIDEVEANWHED